MLKTPDSFATLPSSYYQYYFIASFINAHNVYFLHFWCSSPRIVAWVGGGRIYFWLVRWKRFRSMLRGVMMDIVCNGEAHFFFFEEAGAALLVHVGSSRPCQKNIFCGPKDNQLQKKAVLTRARKDPPFASCGSGERDVDIMVENLFSCLVVPPSPPCWLRTVLVTAGGRHGRSLKRPRRCGSCDAVGAALPSYGLAAPCFSPLGVPWLM